MSNLTKLIHWNVYTAMPLKSHPVVYKTYTLFWFPVRLVLALSSCHCMLHGEQVAPDQNTTKQYISNYVKKYLRNNSDGQQFYHIYTTMNNLTSQLELWTTWPLNLIYLTQKDQHMLVEIQVTAFFGMTQICGRTNTDKYTLLKNNVPIHHRGYLSGCNRIWKICELWEEVL